MQNPQSAACDSHPATMIAVLAKRHLGKTNKTVKYRKVSVINGKILLILMFAEIFTPHKQFADTFFKQEIFSLVKCE